MNDRVGSWMQTSSGRAFWPLDPHPDDIHIEDIAHALAHLCRYGGHCRRFYSVAEHSILVSKIVPPEHAFAGLMHDATEAYLVDLPRPIKRHIQQYKDAEARLWEAIATRFGLPLELPPEVHHADNAILLAERAELMLPSPEGLEWGAELDGLHAPDVDIAGYLPFLAKEFFLKRFHELTEQSNAR